MAEATTRKVVEVINSTPDSEHVRIRNLYEPIFLRLWDIANKELEAYHTDVIHDALILADSKEGDKFLWGYRTTGTNIIRITENSIANAMAVIATMVNPLESWHLIEITKMRAGGHADGYVTWINAQSQEQIRRVIFDNIPSSAAPTSGA